jgi:hypothetical protein
LLHLSTFHVWQRAAKKENVPYFRRSAPLAM